MSTNKTIAKNTIFLYIRMFFNLLVSLYTSRLVLQTLGIEDFGIYNLVAGIVVLFSFLNGSLNASTQRFINFEKASDDTKKVNKIFNISCINHIIISILVLFLAETIGLWFLNYKLNIPSNRIQAANWVYQISILTTLLGILRVPLNAMILAYEKMSYYAYIGILETTFRLIIIFILLFFQSVDHLILYTALILVANFIPDVIMFYYCRKNFRLQTNIRFYRDYKKMKEMLFFSSWILFGQIAMVCSSQGLSFILNIFYGVTVNAALGIASQVNSAVYGFVSNFQVAFNPQIVQSYALGEFDRNKTLVLNTSKYSFFLMALISAPILYYTHFILSLWLGTNLPLYVEGFVQVVIICSLLDALAGPFWMAATAIGSIKVYNITLTLLNFCTLPLAYFLLKLGYSPYYAYISKIFIYIMMQTSRYYLINRYLKFKSKEAALYFLSVSVIFLMLLILIYLNKGSLTTYNLTSTIIGSMFIEVILISLIFAIGLNSKERNLVINFITPKIKKIFK